MLLVVVAGMSAMAGDWSEQEIDPKALTHHTAYTLGAPDRSRSAMTPVPEPI